MTVIVHLIQCAEFGMFCSWQSGLGIYNCSGCPMKIAVSVKSELSLGNVCNQEFSSFKHVRNGSTSRSSHFKTNKNHWMKNLLLSWSDMTICSMFHFSMSSCQNSSWASFLFHVLRSKQATENIFIHKKWCYGTLHHGKLLIQKNYLYSKNVQSNSWMKHP